MKTHTRYLEYKSLDGSIEVSMEDNCLFGRIPYIKDIVTYERNTPKELEIAFRNAVTDYLSELEDKV